MKLLINLDRFIFAVLFTLVFGMQVTPKITHAALSSEWASAKLYYNLLSAEKYRDEAKDVVVIEIRSLKIISSWRDDWLKNQKAIENKSNYSHPPCEGVTTWQAEGRIYESLRGDLKEGENISLSYETIDYNCPGAQQYGAYKLIVGDYVETYLDCKNKSCSIAAGHHFSFISKDKFEERKTEAYQEMVQYERK